MLSLFAVVFMICAFGLLGASSSWCIPFFILATACLWYADRLDWDAETLGGAMILLFGVGILYYTLSTAWDWGRSML